MTLKSNFKSTTKALFGHKLAMGQLFQENGILIPVTFIQIGPNRVAQIKTADTKDGYDAIQVIVELRNKPARKTLLHHLKRIQVKNHAKLREIRGKFDVKLNDQLPSDLFKPGEMVDVIAISKGKGTAGVIKLHNFGRGPMSHGSKHHRAPGSVGLSRPDKIWKGQPLPGRKGNRQTTVRNLQIIALFPNHNVIAIKGAIPGINSALVQIRAAKIAKSKSAPKLYQVKPIQTDELTKKAVK